MCAVAGVKVGKTFLKSFLFMASVRRVLEASAVLVSLDVASSFLRAMVETFEKEQMR
jgi:hypothetical protein